MKTNLKHKRYTIMQENLAKGEMVGTVYRKQLVRFGKWINPLYPIEEMELDKEWAQQIVKNFNKKIVDRIPVPANHTDDVEANRGELVKLEIESDGLYGYLDIRDQETVDKIENGLIFDVSISFDWDYVDTEKGKHYGPTLLHVALVNNPYLNHMEGFETAEDLIKDLSQRLNPLGLAMPSSSSAIMLSESKAKELNQMDKAKVKNNKEFDVTVSVKEGDEVVEKVIKAGEEIEVPKDQAQDVLTQVEDFEDPSNNDDDDEDENDEDDEGDKDGKNKKKDDDENEDEDDDDSGDDDDDEEEDDDSSELSRTRKELAEYKAKEQFNELLSKGKITPAQKEAFMELAKVSATTGQVQLSKGKKVTLLDALSGVLMAGPKVVKFSEDGSGQDGDDDDSNDGKDKDDNKKPSENLSEAESAGMKATGADPKRMDELAEKHPAMADSLKKLNKSEGDK